MSFALFFNGGSMKTRSRFKSAKVHPKLRNQNTSDLDPLEISLSEEVSLAGEEKLAANPPFHSELEYEGYRNIESYDNDALSGNVEECRDFGKPLRFADREINEGPEEDSWDKQENWKLKG
jgi:hypothetical protein